MSIGARMVRARSDLDAGLRFTLRERVRRRLMLLPLPEDAGEGIGEGRALAHGFIAEEALRGVQVTVDGFMDGGRATVTGVVDSVMYPGTSSFERFEYPSRLPAAVQRRMAEVAARLHRPE